MQSLVIEHEYVTKRHCHTCSLIYSRQRKKRAIPTIAEPHDYVNTKHCRACTNTWRRNWERLLPMIMTPHPFVDRYHCQSCLKRRGQRTYRILNIPEIFYLHLYVGPTHCQQCMSQARYRYRKNKYAELSASHTDHSLIIVKGCHCTHCDERRRYNRDQRREYQKLHAGEFSQYHKQYNIDKRRIVVDHYGGKCECCGIDIFDFLTIDHLNGGGNKDRKANRLSSSTNFYNFIIKMGFSSDYRVLCFNCNCSHGLFGYCPHQTNYQPRQFSGLAANSARHRQRLKAKVLDRYGNCCSCCGETHSEFLTMDHINGGGRIDRASKSGYWLKAIIDRDFPADLRILCWNCNNGRERHQGICYHEIERQIPLPISN